MIPGNHGWFAVLLYPPLAAVVMFIVRVCEMARRGRGVPGRVSAAFTLPAMFFAATLILVCGCIEYIVGHRHFLWPWYLVGLTTGGGAFLLRAWAARALGKFWSMQIELRSEQPLVKSGPYRWMRHPIYTAAILEVLTVVLLCQAVWTLLPVFLVFIPVILVRLKLEERAMVAHFGEPYVRYMAEVTALIPFCF